MIDSRAEAPGRLHRGGSCLQITDVEHWYAEHRLAAQLRRDEFLSGARIAASFRFRVGAAGGARPARPA
ncbi:MAG: hypothetical protein ACRDPF_25015 [Streptosporangiaceae bacterium]